jgi:hypothetical protein
MRIMKGLSWRYGYVNLNRVTAEEMRALDSGTLLVTNKRLLFNGSKTNVSIPLTRVIDFTLFKDAIQIEKDSGKDQFFEGDGDIELIGAILNVCLRQSRSCPLSKAAERGKPDAYAEWGMKQCRLI